MSRETTVLAEALLRSLFDRAESLRLYLLDLQGHNIEADRALSSALGMMIAYTRVIASHADAVWQKQGNPYNRVEMMTALLFHLWERERFADERFGRAGQTRVPSTLTSTIKEEGEVLGLANLE